MGNRNLIVTNSLIFLFPFFFLRAHVLGAITQCCHGQLDGGEYQKLLLTVGSRLITLKRANLVHSKIQLNQKNCTKLHYYSTHAYITILTLHWCKLSVHRVLHICACTTENHHIIASIKGNKNGIFWVFRQFEPILSKLFNLLGAFHASTPFCIQQR